MRAVRLHHRDEVDPLFLKFPQVFYVIFVYVALIKDYKLLLGFPGQTLVSGIDAMYKVIKHLNILCIAGIYLRKEWDMLFGNTEDEVHLRQAFQFIPTAIPETNQPRFSVLPDFYPGRVYYQIFQSNRMVFNGILYQIVHYIIEIIINLVHKSIHLPRVFQFSRILQNGVFQSNLCKFTFAFRK